MNNDEFLINMDMIRVHDKMMGTSIESTVYKIIKAFTVYGDPKASMDDMRIRLEATTAAICELAASSIMQNVLDRSLDSIIKIFAEEQEKAARKNKNTDLTATFIKKWAADLEASGKARTRQEAVTMACRDLNDLQKKGVQYE